MAKYEMEELRTDSSVMLSEKQRDGSLYDTSDVENPSVADYIKNIGEMAVNNDRKATAQMAATAKNAHLGSESEIRDYDYRANEAKENAAKAAAEIDVNSISKSDFEKILNAQTNAADKDGKNTLDDRIERTATMRHVIANLDDKQMAAWIGALPPRVQDKMLAEQRETNPQAFPTQEQLDVYKKEIKQAVIDGEPRPDITSNRAIDEYIQGKTNEVYVEHAQTAKAEKEAAKASKMSRFSSTYVASSMNTPSNDMDFGK